MQATKKIVIVSQSHICRNPRVLKEALTLAIEGFNIIILTAIYSEALLNEDLELIKNTTINYEFYSDLRKPSLHSLLARFVRKATTSIQSKFHIESALSLGYNAVRLLKKCISYDAALYIMHQELPTYIGTKLIKEGYNTAFDIEDWYSEDLLPLARNTRPLKLLKQAESDALNKGIYYTTTSAALSNKLALAYSSAKPEVIYNVFPQTALAKKKIFSEPLKLFWFSQTIGEGRGLEKFIQLLYSVKTKLELHLLGNVSPAYKANLQHLMPKYHLLFFS